MKQITCGSFLFALLFLLFLSMTLVFFHHQAPRILVRLYRTEEKKVVTMELDDYVKGVIAAEMPASFHPEAMKAQAVAARTVAVSRVRRFGGRGCKESPEADFSDDYRVDQAWLSQSELQKRWGLLAYKKNWAKITQTVKDTTGLIITYQGRPIDAVYHSTSGPRTENSEDVWGKYYPYLRSVACPYCQHSPRYTEEKVMTLEEFRARLKLQNISIAASSKTLLRVSGVTEGGRVKEVTVGGRIFRGEEFRPILDLKSSRFKYEIGSGLIYFQTTGYGHGVGMCQYGADGMAAEGKDFRQILRYYYQGVEFARLR